MKKQAKTTEKKEKDVTLTDLFKLVKTVASKAKTDLAKKKLIDSAAQKWEDNSRYAV